MGAAERANPVAQAVRAETPGAGAAADLAACPPSEFLEGFARATLAESIAVSNHLRELLKPRSVIAGPGGAPAAPQVNFQAEVLLDLSRLLRGQAIILDLLLTFLTGRPDLKPIPRPTDG